MKKIITTVGTSLFTNYNSDDFKDFIGKESYKSISDDIKKLKNVPYKEYENLKYEIEDIKNIILDRWLFGFKKKQGEWEKTNDSEPNFSASAEISSIRAIAKRNSKEKFKIILISSDTILSFLAAEILNDHLKKIFHNIEDVEVFPIRKLIVTDLGSFQEGLINLVGKIDAEISDTGEHKNDVVLNISGGFKALIPYLTIISMITQTPIYYIFEDSDELIEIPGLPIGFDELFLEDIYFNLQGRELSDQLKIQQLLQYGLIEKRGRKYDLSALGKFIKRYIETKSTQAKNVFGYIMEYKLLEYFYNNPIRMNGKLLRKIERSIPILGKEIDLVMQNNDGGEKHHCFAEIKSIYTFVNQHEKMITDFQSRITKIETTYEKYEYHYYLYSTNKNLRNELIEQRDKVIQDIKRIDSKGVIKFFEVKVPQQSSDDFPYKNPYQSFVASKIKNEHIKEINL